MRIFVKTLLVLLLIFMGIFARKLFELSGNPTLGFVVSIGSFSAAVAVIKYKKKTPYKVIFEIDKTISSDKDNK